MVGREFDHARAATGLRAAGRGSGVEGGEAGRSAEGQAGLCDALSKRLKNLMNPRSTIQEIQDPEEGGEESPVFSADRVVGSHVRAKPNGIGYDRHMRRPSPFGGARRR